MDCCCMACSAMHVTAVHLHCLSISMYLLFKESASCVTSCATLTPLTTTQLHPSICTRLVCLFRTLPCHAPQLICMSVHMAAILQGPSR